MHDPLFLSLWLKNFAPVGLPLYLKKAVAVFPQSRLLPGGVFRIIPLAFREAPLLEEQYDGDLDPQAAASRVQEHLHDDIAIQVEMRWDIYQWTGEWALKPSRVYLEIFGPQFEAPLGEHLRLDLGPQRLYLPEPSSDALRPVQSNIRSVLHLATDLENELIAERRLLWTEDEENFAERLKALLD
ncbi:MAG: hypothetical protein ACOYX1_12915 [Acidobacteriota bacterium]